MSNDQRAQGSSDTYQIIVAECSDDRADARDHRANAHARVSHIGGKQFIGVDVNDRIGCRGEEFQRAIDEIEQDCLH